LLKSQLGWVNLQHLPTLPPSVTANDMVKLTYPMAQDYTVVDCVIQSAATLLCKMISTRPFSHPKFCPSTWAITSKKLSQLFNSWIVILHISIITATELWPSCMCHNSIIAHHKHATKCQRLRNSNTERQISSITVHQLTWSLII